MGKREFRLLLAVCCLAGVAFVSGVGAICFEQHCKTIEAKTAMENGYVEQVVEGLEHKTIWVKDVE